MERKRIALAGASVRVLFGYAKSLLKNFSDIYDIVALFDVDQGKMTGFCELLEKELPLYTDFDIMLDEVKPDEVFISTVDSTHACYLLKAIEKGVACICEKPLCINAVQCKEILSVLKTSDVNAVTAHNARYNPYTTKIKELIDAGEIGDIRSINFIEYLDRRHGASYFRRWNREKAKSGGLLVHKASHHFDLINWFVGSLPEYVVAQGSLIAYGSNASNYGGEICHTCEHTGKCPYYVDYSKCEIQHTLFMKHKTQDSYTPDKCVFSPEIDIEDHATVGIQYINGVEVSYSLNAHSSIEGQDVSIEGSTGRISYKRRDDTGGLKNLEHGKADQFKKELKIQRMDEAEKLIEVKNIAGSHGGADIEICKDLFGAEKSGRIATLEDGVQAVLIGAAANMSIKLNKTIEVQTLLAD
jgi:predicted dehydrogenase